MLKYGLLSDKVQNYFVSRFSWSHKTYRKQQKILALKKVAELLCMWRAWEKVTTKWVHHLWDNVSLHSHEVDCKHCLFQNASKVVALLLSHSASTDLLWSGHSPLSLAIATGNELVNLLVSRENHPSLSAAQTGPASSKQTVEELLKRGADPNIPLGPRVGTALCALTNFHYRLCGNRAKMVRECNVVTTYWNEVEIDSKVGFNPIYLIWNREWIIHSNSSFAQS